MGERPAGSPEVGPWTALQKITELRHVDASEAIHLMRKVTFLISGAHHLAPA